MKFPFWLLLFVFLSHRLFERLCRFLSLELDRLRCEDLCLSLERDLDRFFECFALWVFEVDRDLERERL